MIVTKNIDELFSYNHMSAVIAGSLMPMHRDWIKLNSGTMVITPRLGERDNILSKLEYVGNYKKCFGDQDLLQEYYSNWPNEYELHLDQKYNVFNSSVEHYVKEEGYNCNFNRPDDKSIAIIHFVGKNKPWMLNKIQRLKLLISCLKNKQFNNFKVYKMYFKLLSSVE